jgi:NitT/TauT family transport system permease protein
MAERSLTPPGGLAFVVPAVLIAGWWAATYNHPNGLIPPPNLVVTELVDIVGLSGDNDEFSGSLWLNLVTSASRVYGGFLLSAVLGLSLGMLIGRLAIFQRLLDSSLQMLRPIPVTAWQPLFLILFGLGSRSATLLVALGCFYPILVNTIFGVRSVEPRLIEAATMLGISRAALFPKVVLPSALPGIFTGLRLGLGFAWVVIVVGELSGVRVGLGAMIENAREVSRTDVVIAGMIVIGLAGFLSDQAIRGVSRHFLRWNPQHG